MLSLKVFFEKVKEYFTFDNVLNIGMLIFIFTLAFVTICQIAGYQK